MSTPGTAIARPSRTIIQTTVLRAAPSARRTPISRTRAVTGVREQPVHAHAGQQDRERRCECGQPCGETLLQQRMVDPF